MQSFSTLYNGAHGVFKKNLVSHMKLQVTQNCTKPPHVSSVLIYIKQPLNIQLLYNAYNLYMFGKVVAWRENYIILLKLPTQHMTHFMTYIYEQITSQIS